MPCCQSRMPRVCDTKASSGDSACEALGEHGVTRNCESLSVVPRMQSVFATGVVHDRTYNLLPLQCFPGATAPWKQLTARLLVLQQFGSAMMVCPSCRDFQEAKLRCCAGTRQDPNALPEISGQLCWHDSQHGLAFLPAGLLVWSGSTHAQVYRASKASTQKLAHIPTLNTTLFAVNEGPASSESARSPAARSNWMCSTVAELRMLRMLRMLR